MQVRRKIDQTGRSAGPYSGRSGRHFRPPPGEPWIWLTLDLLSSPARRAMSINARAIFDFLLIEHQSHAALENGRLKAPYDQLEAFGVSRRLIRQALAELHAAGLIRCTRPGGMIGGDRVPAMYRLTMYSADGEPATNEWRSATAEAVIEARRTLADDAKRRRTRRLAKQNHNADAHS